MGILQDLFARLQVPANHVVTLQFEFIRAFLVRDVPSRDDMLNLYRDACVPHRVSSFIAIGALCV
jgi:hypothetical protein